MKAELVPENGDPPIPIDRDLVIIGRRSPCDVVVNHSSLSKRHCVVVKTDGLLIIRDLISTNGTKVKGQRIRWAALLPDDRIALGSYKMRVYLGPDDAAGPSELYRARMGRAMVGTKGKAAEVRTSGPMAVPANPHAGFVPVAGGLPTQKGFPEPSPLEVLVPSSEHDLIPPAAGRRDADDIPFQIVLDDEDDEIIDLD